MEKGMKKIFCLLLFICCLLPVFSGDRISVFIDISGSMDSQLSEIKKYVTEDYIPSLKPDTELRIYKFYGKIRPPIYDGNLTSNSKISWAKKQVNSLVANGPWTNIEGVLDYISKNCVDYGDKFLVLTDGKNEADEKSKAFEITDTLIKEKLGDNARLVSHGKWKTVEFTYEKKTNKVDVNPATVQYKEESDESEKKLTPENSSKVISKRNINFKIFLIPIPLILIILLIILFAKKGSSGSDFNNDSSKISSNVSYRKSIASENTNVRFKNAVENDLTQIKHASPKTQRIQFSDLSEKKQARLKKESAYKEQIIAEAELNKRIADENTDYITTPDGSYPDYYNQPVKVVVVGHEDRGLYGADYNDTLQDAYKDGKIGVNNGYESPNQLGVHRKTLKYTYGLVNDKEKYEDIPNANDLGKNLGTDNGHSYAFINESKASNLRDDSQILNKPQYEDFVDRNAKNGYMREQMDIMKPDIVIGQKMSEKTIQSLGEAKLIHSENGTNLYKITDSKGRSYRLINNKNHFSARTQSDSVEYAVIRKLSKMPID